ncbi:O-antigen/teichoic acid export membrane protein [Arcicella aurantiaca]|uniref:O-antigen/teichoic acid export membrane protein n=1 Tax=Arcicella aurantiaca TaxID=591202 RepID=A0A316F086_9BACT|nr:oligosaccharide flippase family protein [Arcicella aurantiaca]PWK28976.1 O-antigen/teichoic acid export membrane protein [Arcicella aurantiaca]
MKAKSIIQNIGANLLIAIFGLVGSIILARWLGPSQRGVFATIIIIPSTLQYFVNFGLSSATVYFSAKPNVNKHSIWHNLLVIASIQSLIGILLGWAITNLYLQKYDENVTHLGHLYLLTIPLGLFGMYANYMLQGASFFKTTNMLKCVVPIGYCTGIIILKITNILSITNLVYLQILLQSCYLIVAIFFLYRLILHYFSFQYDFQYTRKLLNYGVKVWFGDVAQLANSRIDQFLIGGFLSSHDLGIYTVAVSIAGFTGIFANAVRTIIVPSVTEKDHLQAQIKSTILLFKSYWIFSIIFHILFAFSLSFLIPFVFGSAYSESIKICQLLVIGSFFINAKTVLAGGIQGMGFPEAISFAEFSGMILSLILTYFLINSMGLIGVSIAISLAYFSQFIGIVFFANKKGIIYKNLLFASQKEINYYLRRFKKNILRK